MDAEAFLDRQDGLSKRHLAGSAGPNNHRSIDGPQTSGRILLVTFLWAKPKEKVTRIRRNRTFIQARSIPACKREAKVSERICEPPRPAS